MAHLAGPARLEPLELLVGLASPTGLAGLVGLSLNAAISVSILTCSAKT
jgi:hypothetical protein